MSHGGTESAVVEGSLAVALTAAGVLHVTGAGPVDPLRTVISDYVVVPGGYELLALAAVALAAASLALAAGLRRSGLPRPTIPAALLVTGGMGLLVAGLVPTNLPGQPIAVGALVHRAAGGLTFTALPLAGWLIAGRAAVATAGWRRSAPVLRVCAGAAVLLASAFLIVQIPIVIADSPIFPYVGGVERVVCATVMVVLLTTGWAMRAATIGAVSTRAARTPAPLAAEPALVELGRAA